MIEKFSGDVLQWLRGFYYVAECGSVSEAASRINLIQSAVSHHIRNLEKELNVTLFERGRKDMILTQDGRLLYEKAIRLFEMYRELREEVGHTPHVLKGTVSFATTHALAMVYLPSIIASFHAMHPQVTFAIEGGGFAHVLQKVEGSVMDFGFINKARFPNNVEYTPLFDSRMVLISPKGNPFGLPPCVAFEDLTGVPFISFPPNSTVEKVIESSLQRRDIALNKFMEINNYALLLKYVSMGLGVTILDVFTLMDQGDSFHTHELADPLPNREYGLVVKKDKYLAPQVKAFLNHLQEAGVPDTVSSAIG